MLKLKLQYFSHLMRRANSLEKTLMLGKIEGRRRGWQRMRRLDGITDWMDMSLTKFRKWWKDREVWCAAVYRVAKRWTRLSNWTKTTEILGWVSIPMDRGACWATIHGITKTQTQLKQLTLHNSAQNIRSGFSRKDVFVLYTFCLRWSYCIAQEIIFL